MTARALVIAVCAAVLVAATPVRGQDQPAPNPSVASGSGPVLLASADAATVIRAVLTAPTLVDYEGTKILTALRGQRAETVTILESYKRSGKLRLEFLSPESASGRLIVDDGASSWHYEPSRHIVMRGPSFVTAQPAVDPALILSRYDAMVLGNEQVIGRQTVVLSLQPRGGGLVKRLWVDQATGVVLRTEERDPSGELLFSSLFSRISYSLNLPSALFRFHLPAGARIFSFYVSGDPITDPQELSRQAKFALRAPIVLAGLRFRSGTVARHGALTAVTAQYTDGVGVVSVFQTPASRMAMPEVGATVALRGMQGRWLDLGYFRILMWQSGGVSFAVIGTLPLHTLITIAEELNAAAR